jgi:hypothetical protein
VSGLVPRCGWCETPAHRLPDDGRLVLVGIIEPGSGPGWPVHACSLCVARNGIVPAAEHAPDWLGEVRYRPRTAT